VIPPEFFLTTREWFLKANYGEPVLGLLMTSVGVLCLLLGWRLYRIVVLINVAVLCGLIGGWIMGASLLGIIGWLVGAVAGSVLAWRFPHRSSVVLGGLLAAYVCGHFLEDARASDQTILIVGSFILLTVIAFGLVHVRHTIIVVTAFQGALLTIWGVINMAYESRRLAEQILDLATPGSIFIPFTVMAVMGIGVFLQIADSNKQKVGLSG
jgi:hypothetical protein